MTRFLTLMRQTVLLAGQATALVAMLAVLAVPLHARGQDPGQERVIATIKGWGGRVQQDLKSPGRPVIGIGLAGTKVPDADLALLKQF
jgi:hypothetical protein